MRGPIAWWIRVVLGHRAAVLAVVGALSLLAVWPLSRAHMGSSLASMFFEDDNPDFKRYQIRIAQFRNDEVIAVAIEGSAPLAVETLDKLDAVHAEIEENPQVVRVESLASLERVISGADSVEIQRVAKAARAAPDEIEALRRELVKDPVAGGLFVASEGDHLLVMVELTHDEARSSEQNAALVGEVLAAFEAQGFDRDRTHAAGMPVTTSEMLKHAVANLERLFPLVVLVLLLTVFALFGRLWPVVITTAVSSVTVLWTMGLSALVEPQINIMVTAIPGVLMIISFSDIIHICSAYLLELSQGHDKAEAIERSGADVGTACALTSATTCVGFVSMAFIPTPIFRHFGALMGVGIVFAFVLALTLVPICLSAMKTPAPWSSGRTGRIQGALDASLEWVSHLTRRHPWPIIACFIAAAAVSVTGASRLNFEADFNKRMAEDSRLRVDQRYLESHFIGTATVQLFLETDRAEGLLDEAVFNEIAHLEAELEALPQVDRVVSLVDMTRGAFDALIPPELERDFLPLTRQGIAQLMVVVEMQGLDALRPFVDLGRRTMQMTIYTREQGVRAHAMIGAKAVEMANARLRDKGVRAETTGMFYLMGNWVDELFDGQRRGLLVSILLIALLMMIGLRSIGVGIWSMLPNLLPLLAVGGAIGWAWDVADTDTFGIAMIAIGIGVDDTIHFLSRLKLESARCEDHDEAISRTFRFAGRGIVITTVIFTLGFLPMGLSDYMSLAFYGTLLPACFVVALLADILWLPAMARVGAIRFKGAAVGPRQHPSQGDRA